MQTWESRIRYGLVGLVALGLLGSSGAAQAASFVDSSYGVVASAEAGFEDAQEDSGSGSPNFDIGVAPFAIFDSSQVSVESTAFAQSNGLFLPDIITLESFGDAAVFQAPVGSGGPLPQFAFSGAAAEISFELDAVSLVDIFWDVGATARAGAFVRVEDALGQTIVEVEIFEGEDDSADGQDSFLLEPGIYTALAFVEMGVDQDDLEPAPGAPDVFGAFASAQAFVGIIPNEVPEPTTGLLMGLGLIGALALPRVRARAA